MILRPYILHPEWLGSDRVVGLRDHVKLFFLKIGNVTDGAGRFEADAAMLRAALYPKELHKVSERDVKGMMEQIHTAGLVRLYTRAGKGFGEVTIYKQLDSKRKVRFPGPDAGELNFAMEGPSPAEPGPPEVSPVAARPRPEMKRNESPQSPPAGGLLQISPSSERVLKKRSPERVLATARDELGEVESALEEILRPGGCAYNVQPKGEALARFEKLSARRKELKGLIGEAKKKIEKETDA